MVKNHLGGANVSTGTIKRGNKTRNTFRPLQKRGYDFQRGGKTLYASFAFFKKNFYLLFLFFLVFYVWFIDCSIDKVVSFAGGF